MKTICHMTILSSISLLCAYAHTEKTAVNIYSSALETTIGMCHDLVMLSDAKLSMNMRTLCDDALLGKAYKLTNITDTLISHSRTSLLADDGVYLLSLIVQLEQELMKDVQYAQAYSLVAQIRERLLQACHALIACRFSGCMYA